MAMANWQRGVHSHFYGVTMLNLFDRLQFTKIQPQKALEHARLRQSSA